MRKKCSKLSAGAREILIACTVALCAGFLVFVPDISFANPDAPRLANYYLHWSLTTSEADSLARWDLVILDAENQFKNPDMLKRMRRLNPRIVILAYITPQEIKQDAGIVASKLRNDLYSKISGDWYLKNSKGTRLNWWPGTYLLNVTNNAPTVNGKRFNQFFSEYTANTILGSGLWDGVFYDNAWDNITHFVGADVDVNGDTVADKTADAAWQEGMRFIYSETKRLAPGKIIVGNGTTRSYRNNLNGNLIENFIAPAWGPTMETYKFNDGPDRINIINSNSGNGGGSQNDYRKVRFDLGSTLMEDGYFSYDYGDTNHGQLWWYDEYNTDLGSPQSDSFSQKGLKTYQPDVWRRDFENGVTIVNSTDKEQIVPLDGEYEKIHGVQDKNINNGSIVNEVSLDEYDGLILLKTFSTLDDVVFENGAFARFFDEAGARVRNGFFVFEDKYRGGDTIAHIDLDGNGKRDLLLAHGPKLTAWRDDGQLLLQVYPYSANYTGKLRVAIGDIHHNNTQEIFVAPSVGYPAPIKVYNADGSTIKNDWFPYGTQYKGGYNITIANFGADLGNNVVVGSGVGREPMVDIYDYAFNRISGWQAFEPTFKGGIDVTSANIDADPYDEIIVGAGEGKEPIIRVFKKDGTKLFEFKAYTSIAKPGIRVGVVDVDFDGVKDIVGFSEGPGL